MSNTMIDDIIRLCTGEIVQDIEDKCLQRLIEEQAQKSPDAIAIVSGCRQITYRELNNSANYLAAMLRTLGIGPEKIIAVIAEHSIEAIAAILGVIKAGAAFLPLDPAYDETRIGCMLEDGECSAVLLQKSLRRKLPPLYRGKVIELDELTEREFPNPDIQAKASSTAYIMPTSGSTGRPKGVAISNLGFVNYVSWAAEYYCSDCIPSFPLYTSLSFDLTLTSIFVPLIKGGTIYIMHDKSIQAVAKHRDINFIKLTPAQLALLKEEDNTKSNVKGLIVGGEGLKSGIAEAALRSYGGSVKIYNEYGPTETVVGSSVYEYDPKDRNPSVLIGRPIQNTRIYILDRELKPMPPGEIGEIYIAGAGVAKGYLKRQKETEQSFMADPYVQGERMYKTGDLGRYLPNRNIEYIGRIGIPETDAVLSGKNLPVDVIEAVLLKYPEIKDATVVVGAGENAEKYLAAYYISDRHIEEEALRAYISERLPKNSIPKVLWRLEKMPLNFNGKINRPVLRSMELGFSF